MEEHVINRYFKAGPADVNVHVKVKTKKNKKKRAGSAGSDSSECEECIHQMEVPLRFRVQPVSQSPSSGTGDQCAVASLLLENPDLSSTYQFAEKEIPSRHVFLRTFLSYAFVHSNPAVPGHVLVCPMRTAPKLAKTAKTEMSDLFHTVQLVQHKLEEHHRVPSSTVIIREGATAGTTVKRVRVHVMPTREEDSGHLRLYEKVYQETGEGGKDPNEVAREAAEYRKLFYDETGKALPNMGNEPTEPTPKASNVPTVTFEQQPPSSGQPQTAPISPPSTPSATPGRRCKCRRCRKNQCPMCVGKKKATGTRGPVQRQDGPRLFTDPPSFISREEEPGDWTTMKDSEPDTTLFKPWRAKAPKRKEHQAGDDDSFARTVFAGIFLGVVTAAVISVVQRLT